MPDANAENHASLGDAPLLKRYLRDGDEAAFRQIVERHGPWVMGVCRKNLRDEHAADDAFQATWLVLAENAAKIKTHGALGSWLFGVATRVCARARRREARAESPIEEPIAVTDDPLQHVLAQYERDVTYEVLASLPVGLQQPIILRYMAGRSNRQVADALNLTLAATEGRIKRAKRILRGRLVRRGVTLAVAAQVLKPLSHAIAAIPASLVDRTLLICARGDVPIDPMRVEAIHRLTLGENLVMSSPYSCKALASLAVAACITGVGVGIPAAWSQGSADASGGDPFAIEVTALPGTTASAAEAAPQANLAVAEPDSARDPFAGAPQANAVPSNRPYVKPVDAKSRSRAELAIEAALAENVELEFIDESLGTVVNILAAQYGIRVAVDPRSLEEAGISEETPVTCTASNVTLSSALRIALRPLYLDFTVRDETLIITTESIAAETMDTRVYPIDPSWRIPPEDIVAVVTRTIDPDSWEESGGGASIQAINARIVVRQSYHGHQSLSNLFRQLSASAEKTDVGTTSIAR